VLVEQIEHYRAACRRFDRPSQVVLRRDIHVAETDAAALDHVRPILDEGYRGVTLAELLVGSPDTVIGRLADYHRLGIDRVLVRHVSGDHGAILRSFELIGRHVVPAIEAWPDR
jgi:alkanesulfonate monooxygenase SsuD/methylene tetrahydromethanopterin reductase-like flavin-dependent oxidoreductase (luciferase family)